MKFIKIGVLSMFVALVGAGANAATYHGIDFPHGAASFVYEVLSYTAGTGFPSGSGCQTAANVIGVPDYSAAGPTCNGFASLGAGGELLAKFTDNFLTTSGDSAIDLVVFEIGRAFEPVSVAISTDGFGWIAVETLLGQPIAIDIDVVAGVVDGTLFSYVRLIDGGAGDSLNTIFAGAISTRLGPSLRSRRLTRCLCQRQDFWRSSMWVVFSGLNGGANVEPAPKGHATRYRGA